MKIRVSTLKRIIKEIALSPSAFQNERVNDPFDRPNIAKAVGAIEGAFKTGVAQNLILDEQDSYNAETREFDDEAYARIEEIAQKATEMMMARVHKAVQSSWAEAMKGVGKTAPEKKVA